MPGGPSSIVFEQEFLPDLRQKEGCHEGPVRPLQLTGSLTPVLLWRLYQRYYDLVWQITIVAGPEGA